MPRSIPLSVRINDADAAFLARLDVPDAKTPSDKLRAILKAARRREEGARDFAGCAELVQDMLRPAVHRLREAQRKAGIRSEFVLKVYERMPELMAELIAAAPGSKEDDETLARFERAVADQVFSMIEEILDFGLTSRSRSYDPNLIKERLEPIIEILNLIKLSREQSKGAQNE